MGEDYLFTFVKFCSSVSVWGPVWPDLAKIRHFCHILKACGYFRNLQLALGISLNLLWLIFDAIGQIVIGVSGQILTLPSGHIGGDGVLREREREWVSEWVRERVVTFEEWQLYRHGFLSPFVVDGKSDDSFEFFFEKIVWVGLHLRECVWERERASQLSLKTCLWLYDILIRFTSNCLSFKTLIRFCTPFFKIGHSRPLFLYVKLFFTADSK